MPEAYSTLWDACPFEGILQSHSDASALGIVNPWQPDDGSLPLGPWRYLWDAQELQAYPPDGYISAADPQGDGLGGFLPPTEFYITGADADGNDHFAALAALPAGTEITVTDGTWTITWIVGSPANDQGQGLLSFGDLAARLPNGADPSAEPADDAEVWFSTAPHVPTALVGNIGTPGSWSGGPAPTDLADLQAKNPDANPSQGPEVENWEASWLLTADGHGVSWYGFANGWVPVAFGIAGTPGTWVIPDGETGPPADYATLTAGGGVASYSPVPPVTWQTGEHVILGDGSHAYWTANEPPDYLYGWQVGDAPDLNLTPKEIRPVSGYTYANNAAASDMTIPVVQPDSDTQPGDFYLLVGAGGVEAGINPIAGWTAANPGSSLMTWIAPATDGSGNPVPSPGGTVTWTSSWSLGILQARAVPTALSTLTLGGGGAYAEDLATRTQNEISNAGAPFIVAICARNAVSHRDNYTWSNMATADTPFLLGATYIENTGAPAGESFELHAYVIIADPGGNVPYTWTDPFGPIHHVVHSFGIGP